MSRTRPERIICILGMHRSGTSCLTGSLQQGGLELGKFHTFNEYNRKGNRENQDVVSLHEGLLRANNASWDNPPQHPEWTEQHILRAREILETYAHIDFWGFKDPRTLLFIDGWLKLVPDMEFVGIFRHPHVVARSLNARKALPISIEKGLELWLHYNRQLLAQLQRQPFPLLCFDWPEEQFHAALDILHARLGLDPIPPDARFYTSELHKHHLDQVPALAPEIQSLYDELKQYSLA